MSDWKKGKIRKIFPDRGYGFIDAGLGKDIFFHLKTFGRFERDFVKEGVEVRFQIEENGDKLRAYRVSLVVPEGAAKC